MLYYFFNYLEELNVPGMGVFQYISFRTAAATILSLLISLVFGKTLIRWLQTKQIGETIRNLGIKDEQKKAGTPTMGGIIIIAAIVIPTLLFARISNIYIVLMVCTTLWLGLIGFADDYIKVFKKNKEGLSGRYKVLGQLILGIAIGATMFWHPSIVTRERVPANQVTEEVINDNQFNAVMDEKGEVAYYVKDEKSVKTNVPFLKSAEFDYAKIIGLAGSSYAKYAWIPFIIIIALVLIAVSNGANLTDGMDGLAAGTSAIIGVTLGLLSYLSGSYIFANYLNIFFIPHLGELAIFAGAFVGACIGFLWYNVYPAQVFMGDTGSLAIGGIIATFAIVIRKELLIPILCGIFLVENLSVIIQVSYFKYTKMKTGEGKRIFLMSPLHHHYQKKGIPEPKIVARFWIVGILLAIVTLATLKLR
jgi:phospho-N-acetylmuramoyl-pentapeptide-transferase